MRSEDQVYAEYCLEKNPLLLTELISLVKTHAFAVTWMVLKENRPDIVNEVLEAVLRQLPRFKNKSKFSTWVEAITRNICKRKLRYHIRHKTDVSIEDANPAVFEENALHSRLELETIRNKLTDPEDKILIDSMLEGAGFEEIQKRLNLDTFAAARTKWYRLRQRLIQEQDRAG